MVTEFFSMLGELKIVAFAAGGAYLLHLILRRGLEQKKLHNVSYVLDHEDQIRTAYIPLMLAFFPIVEEGVFRLPLILFFDGFSILACISLSLSALVFGSLHVFSSQLTYLDLIHTPTEKIDDIQLPPAIEAQRKMAKMVLLTTMGAASGFLALRTQTIFWPVLLHAGWNVFFPVLGPPLLFILTPIVYLLSLTISLVSVPVVMFLRFIYTVFFKSPPEEN